MPRLYWWKLGTLLQVCTSLILTQTHHLCPATVLGFKFYAECITLISGVEYCETLTLDIDVLSNINEHNHGVTEDRMI